MVLRFIITVLNYFKNLLFKLIGDLTVIELIIILIISFFFFGCSANAIEINTTQSEYKYNQEWLEDNQPVSEEKRKILAEIKDLLEAEGNNDRLVELLQELKQGIWEK